jgi:hypothetical protein
MGCGGSSQKDAVAIHQKIEEIPKESAIPTNVDSSDDFTKSTKSEKDYVHEQLEELKQDISQVRYSIGLLFYILCITK